MRKRDSFSVGVAVVITESAVILVSYDKVCHLTCLLCVGRTIIMHSLG